MPPSATETEVLRYGEQLTNGDDGYHDIVTSVPGAPVTEERKPFIAAPGSKLKYPSIARANLAATLDKPHGTTTDDWAKKHEHQTVLQQHCDWFDRDHDGVLWPSDTWVGFNRLGFGIFLSTIAMIIIHINFSYPTSAGWLPDPFFRINLIRVDRTKHGSDTGAYDSEGRFVPQKFEEIFLKYAPGRDYMTLQDVANMIRGQRCVSDPIGWGGMVFEWGATYLMLWPEDGKMYKEQIRSIYDGSIFHTWAAQVDKKRKNKQR
ncbi:hypothetical protein ACN47E_008556 [Coniothyrium glycines]